MRGGLAQTLTRNFQMPPHFWDGIFLAGHTPRLAHVPSWRPGALAILKDDLNFEGTVFVPEAADGKPHDD